MKGAISMNSKKNNKNSPVSDSVEPTSGKVQTVTNTKENPNNKTTKDTDPKR